MNQNNDKRTFSTGAQRDRKRGKGMFHLISAFAMFALARRLEEGAEYYGERNWEKGMNLSEFLDSGLRHIFSILAGDETEDHAAAAMWNIMCFIHTKEMIRRGVLPDCLDDLPRYQPKTEEPVEPDNVIQTQWIVEREKKRLCEMVEDALSSGVYGVSTLNRKSLYSYMQGRLGLVTFRDWAIKQSNVSVTDLMLQKHNLTEKELVTQIKQEIAAYISDKATKMLNRLDEIGSFSMTREEIEEELAYLVRYE